MTADIGAPVTTRAPSAMVAISVTAYVSNRSAAMPAQSPTLSPTLSAITAGLRGSSSGMPASIFPTRSAPTSAAFVKMPPPRREKTGDRAGTERDVQRLRQPLAGGLGGPDVRADRDVHADEARRGRKRRTDE